MAEAEARANPEPLDEFDNAVCQYLKRSTHPTLTGILDLWAWSRGIEPAYASLHLSHIAEHLCVLVERLDLVGVSMTGHRGAAGLFADADPCRAWCLCLVDLNPQGGTPRCQYVPSSREARIDQIDSWYQWARFISVLCSRLRMARVADLPGYDHNATAGPFGVVKEDTP